MTKKFCDCCGKEIKGMGAPISVPCHLYSFANNVSGMYVDIEGNRISGKYDTIDLCVKCSNEVFSSAMKKFYAIQAKDYGYEK